MDEIKRKLLDSSLERLVASSRSGGRVIPMKKIVDLALSVEEAKYVTGYLKENKIALCMEKDETLAEESVSKYGAFERFLSKEFIPHNLSFYEKVSDKGNVVSFVPVIDIDSIRRLNLDDEKLRYLIKYLRKSEIKAIGLDPLFNTFSCYPDAAVYASLKVSGESLPVHESLALINKYVETGDFSYRNKVVEGNQVLAYYAAYLYEANMGINFDELLSSAYLGLMDGVDKYVSMIPAMTNFAYYLVVTMKQRMLCDRAEILGDKRGKFFDSYLMLKMILDDGGVATSEGENDKFLAIAEYLIDNGIMAASSREYIEDKLSITYPDSLEELMKQGDVPFKEKGVVSIFDDNLENLRLVFGMLKPRYQEFVKYKFGYDGGGETSITKTGAHFGVSNVRASQIIRSSIDKLREVMFDNGDGEDVKVKKK